MRQFTIFILAALVLSLTPFVMSQEMTLEYLYRYNCQQAPPADHLMTAVQINSDTVLVAGNRGLGLLDLNNLPIEGTRDNIYFLEGLNTRNVYLKDNYIFVNINQIGRDGSRYGFAVVKREKDQLKLITQIGIPGVLCEKMFIDGDYLFVAAHANGLRIYDISNPENPQLVGHLDTGFVDAFAVAVSGDMAFVADGAGGLKIVDVQDVANPIILGGENLHSAVGTAEAVTIRNGDVYVAIGAAGVAVYPGGDINLRTIYDTSGFAEDMCWAGEYLAVSTYPGPVIFEIDKDGSLIKVASDMSVRRDTKAILRINCGIGSTDDMRIMCGNWNYLDIYQLKPAGESSQPDINCTAQRLRFDPEGGTIPAKIYNNGQGDLTISNVSFSSSAFSTSLENVTIVPGDSLDFEINYDGSENGVSDIALIYSNDPDENPLPIQAFGKTEYLDPGEQAVDFTLPLYSRDQGTGEFSQQTFTLSEHKGKVVFFAIYGSW